MEADGDRPGAGDGHCRRHGHGGGELDGDAELTAGGRLEAGRTDRSIKICSAAVRLATHGRRDERAAGASTNSEAAIDACNRAAASAPSTKDKTVEVVKDGAVAALVGAAVGAAGGAIADGGKGAGKGAAIGGAVGAGAGTLYGLSENRKNDERYRAAYAACMRSRGFGG